VTVIVAPSVACGCDGENSPGISSRYEARKSDLVRNDVEVAGKRPSHADQRHAALHAAMGDILKIVRCGSASEPRGRDGRDHQPVPAMRARKEETRKVRSGNVLVMHEVIPVPRPPDSTAVIPRPNYEGVNKYLCDAQTLCIAT
jgi:hypothetical protein